MVGVAWDSKTITLTSNKRNFNRMHLQRESSEKSASEVRSVLVTPAILFVFNELATLTEMRHEPSVLPTTNNSQSRNRGNCSAEHKLLGPIPVVKSEGFRQVSP